MYTKMFRDPEVWQALEEIMRSEVRNYTVSKYHSIVPDIPRNPEALKIFRIWSAGCATGEEAYSLEIMLEEIFERERAHWKIYATDIREDLRFTIGDLRSQSRIRFRKHDLVINEPLKLMNLVFCRNTMMFFTQEYQEIICDNLYKSLRTGGYLVLGKAESLRGEAAEKLKTIDKRLKIYQKTNQ